ncbi:hypothetical protein EXIGLDRAFT_338726 [Exidia glandulosa HHB12029]|uniref:Uncharacterized protein n=1 Tax=Exidia glandulosa HHB12029 TaxID=1314781 RepID=A0A165CK55_EXIGL|nr:hypothetical protein EXIGLDRAFT_338726 [Exidia glandulosa HHB12029]
MRTLTLYQVYSRRLVDRVVQPARQSRCCTSWVWFRRSRSDEDDRAFCLRVAVGLRMVAQWYLGLVLVTAGVLLTVRFGNWR